MVFWGFFLLIYTFFSSFAFPVETEDQPGVEHITFRPEIQHLIKEHMRFCTLGYTEEADTLARKNTQDIGTLFADMELTKDEFNELVGIHLRTEFYYALNSVWNCGATRNPRHIYDFLSQLDKGFANTPKRKKHLTTFTILSLAAHEYFWNERSSTEDLKKHVARELRYGLFRESDHVLDMTSLLYLDEGNISRISNALIDELFREALSIFTESYGARRFGKTYADIYDHLNQVVEAQLKSPHRLSLDILPENLRDQAGLYLKLPLCLADSFPDGMCGQHSLFIRTDGPLAASESTGIAEGNGRYKMLRAILDNTADVDARRIYLMISRHMDGVGFSSLIEKMVAELGERDVEQASALRERMIQYSQFKSNKQAENEEHINQSKREMLTAVIALPALEDALKDFHAKISDPEQLKVLILDKNFRDIIDAILSLRKARPTIDERLAGIDVEIERLSAEIAAEKTAAVEKVRAERTRLQEEIKKLRTESQEYQQQHQAEVNELAVLVSRRQQLLNLIQRKQVQGNSEQLKQNVEKQFKDFEEKYPEFAQFMNEKQIAIAKVQQEYKELREDTSLYEQKLAEKYTLICETIKEFLNPSMLPGKSADAFLFDELCESGYSIFITEVCQPVAELLQQPETARSCGKLWDDFQDRKDIFNHQVEQDLIAQRLEIVSSLTEFPEELSPASLGAEMQELALRGGELGGWLPCDSAYVQLWAVLHNLNVFVISDQEHFGNQLIRPKLNLMSRFADQPYAQQTILYPPEKTGFHLAMVILTSERAKNVVLRRQNNHYEKLYDPTDHIATSMQQRHLKWIDLGEKMYESYPQKVKAVREKQEFSSAITLSSGIIGEIKMTENKVTLDGDSTANITLNTSATITSLDLLTPLTLN